jgi:hypothetical protein
VNRHWGRTATYTANENLLAGRIVSLADQPNNHDSITGLKVGYLKVGGSVITAITPIGVTQHDCLAGEKILVCILGYTTVISTVASASTGPERGSVVLAGADVDLGQVRIATAGAAVQARIGFVAQSSAVVIGGPVLIYYDGYFQAT